MSAGDTARSNAEKAKDETLLRIQLRDQVLLAYLSTVGALFGIAFGTKDIPKDIQTNILLVIPYLTLGASFIIAQHNSMIGSIGSFIGHQITPFLEGIGENAPLWETSAELKEYSSKMLLTRSMAHYVLLLVPSLTVLTIIICYRNELLIRPYRLIWIAGLLAIILSSFFLWQSNNWRQQLYQRKGRFSSENRQD